MKASMGFEERRVGLETAFFREHDAELLDKMRQKLAGMEEQLKLANVSGILDESVLRDLLHAGVRAETLLAMRLAPMIAVAWSDRVLSREEREAVLKAATDVQIVPGTPAYDLLFAWLQRSPDARIIKAWKEYITEVVKVMPPESLKELRDRTVRLCHMAAKAASGVLGIRRISKVEQETINELVGAFDVKAPGLVANGGA